MMFTPAPLARRASSGSQIPLRTMGNAVISRMRAIRAVALDAETQLILGDGESESSETLEWFASMATAGNSP